MSEVSSEAMVALQTLRAAGGDATIIYSRGKRYLHMDVIDAATFPPARLHSEIADIVIRTPA